MEYEICQNAPYVNHKWRKPYFVRDMQGKPLGPRNKNGIKSIGAERLHIDTASFDGDESLDVLLDFLARKQIPFIEK